MQARRLVVDVGRIAVVVAFAFGASACFLDCNSRNHATGPLACDDLSPLKRFVSERIQTLLEQATKASDLTKRCGAVKKHATVPMHLSSFAANATAWLVQLYHDAFVRLMEIQDEWFFPSYAACPSHLNCFGEMRQDDLRICASVNASVAEAEAICDANRHRNSNDWTILCQNIPSVLKSITRACSSLRHRAGTAAGASLCMLKYAAALLDAFKSISAQLQRYHGPYYKPLMNEMSKAGFKLLVDIPFFWKAQKSILADTTNLFTTCTNATATAELIDPFIARTARSLLTGVSLAAGLCEQHQQRRPKRRSKKKEAKHRRVSGSLQSLADRLRQDQASYVALRDRALSECSMARPELPPDLQSAWMTRSSIVQSYFVEIVESALTFLTTVIVKLSSHEHPPVPMRSQLVLVGLIRIYRSVFPDACVQERIQNLTIQRLDDFVFKVQAVTELLPRNSGVYLFRISKRASGNAKAFANVNSQFCQLMLDFADSAAAKQGAVFVKEDSNDAYAARLLNFYSLDPQFSSDTPDMTRVEGFTLGTSYQAHCRAFANPRPHLRWFIGGVEIPGMVGPDDYVPSAILSASVTRAYSYRKFEYWRSKHTQLFLVSGSNCTFVESNVSISGNEALQLRNCRSVFQSPSSADELSEAEFMAFETQRCGHWWTKGTMAKAGPLPQDCKPFAITYGKSCVARRGGKFIRNYHTQNGTYETLSTLTFNTTTDLADLVCCAEAASSTTCKRMQYAVSRPLRITSSLGRVYHGDSLTLSCTYPAVGEPSFDLPVLSINFPQLAFYVDSYGDLATPARLVACRFSIDTVLSWQVSTIGSSEMKSLGSFTVSQAAAGHSAKNSKNDTDDYAVRWSVAETAHGHANSEGLALVIRNVSSKVWENAVFTCVARSVTLLPSGETEAQREAQNVVCGRPEEEDRVPEMATFKLVVHSKIPPYFADSQTRNHFVSRLGENATMECDALGDPLPTIAWLRNAAGIAENQSSFVLSANKRKLLVKDVNSSLLGEYTCIASSGGKTASARFRLQMAVIEDPSNRKTVVPATIIMGVLFVCSLAFALWASERRRRRSMLEEIAKMLNARGVDTWPSETGSAVEMARNLPYAVFDEIPSQRLRFDRWIGAGAYGVVYEGRLRTGIQTMEPVAIKKPRRHGSKEQDYYEALVAELKIMANLAAHPNLLRLVGAVTKTLTINGDLWLVLELCSCSLLTWLHRQRDSGRLDAKKVCKLLRICAGVSNGMEYLGERNVVHRDLAARNVLVTADLTPKICDYGLAKLLSKQGTYKLKSGTACYTAWTSPELTDGKIASTMSDVWSFGVLLWEVFTLGKDPFTDCYRKMRGEKWFDVSLFLAYISSLPDGPYLSMPRCAPEAICKMMRKCMTRKAEGRPTFAECSRCIDGEIWKLQQHAHPESGNETVTQESTL